MEAKTYKSWQEVPKELRNSVYVLELGDNIIKIGCSVNPRQRIQTHSKTMFEGSIKRIAVFDNLPFFKEFEERFHSRMSKWFVSFKDSTETYKFDNVNSFDFFISAGFVVAYQGFLIYNESLIEDAKSACGPTEKRPITEPLF